MTKLFHSLRLKFLLFILISVLLITGCGPRTLPVVYDPVRFTDKDVVEFNNRLTVMMQSNRNWNSIMRYVTSVVAIGAVASSGALGIAGVSSDIIGYTVLGGGFVGSMQGLFQTRERASAYQQGINLLYEASDRYLHTRASVSTNLIPDSKNSGLIPNDSLTKPGADLYTESLASLKLVEKALISQIPTVEEVQKAVGKYKKFNVFPTKVSSDAFPESVKDKDGNLTASALDITVMEGGPVVSVSSGNSAAISATIKPGNSNQVVLTLLNKEKLKGNVEVQLMNAQNVSATVTIKSSSEALDNRNETNKAALNEYEREKITKDDIIIIQAHLKIPQTGKLDAMTRSKIQEIQKKRGLSFKNGQLDENTYSVIVQQAASSNQSDEN